MAFALGFRLSHSVREQGAGGEGRGGGRGVGVGGVDNGECERSGYWLLQETCVGRSLGRKACHNKFPLQNVAACAGWRRHGGVFVVQDKNRASREETKNVKRPLITPSH